MSDETRDTSPGADRSDARPVGRIFLVISVPFFLFTAGVVWLVGYSGLAGDFAAIARSERVDGVRYAIEHTEPRFVPHLMFTAGRAPAEWDARQIEAVADLLTRTGWPTDPTSEVANGSLLAREPSAWSPAEAAAVEELLLRFRSFHRAR